jgi:hypothetical protein
VGNMDMPLFLDVHQKTGYQPEKGSFLGSLPV